MVVTFFLNFSFLLTLLMVNSNKTFLLVILLYLIILILKTQSYRLSLLLVFVNLLPLTIGRNILDVKLIGKEEIFSFALFDVRYFLPIYVSDLFLLLIYQNYFSRKFFSSNPKNVLKPKISPSTKYAFIALTLFFLLILLGTISHEFSTLILAGSIIILKYLLIFGLPFITKAGNKFNLKELLPVIASITAFHSLAIVFEQLKGGNLGVFIENRLPGLESGTRAAETSDMLRADGLFNEPNVAATFLLMNITLLVGVGLSQLKKNGHNHPIYFAVSTMALLAIILTGSRSLYFLTALATIFYLVKYQNKIWKYLSALFRFKSFLAAFVLLGLVISPYLINRLQSIDNVFSRDGSLTYRSELNSHVLSMSYNNKLGIGLDLTPYYLARNFKTADSPLVIFDQAPAHNIIIQLLAETGLVATLLFLIFCYLAFRQGCKNEYHYFAVAAMVYFLSAQFHPVFTNHYQLTAFFFLYLGIANTIPPKGHDKK